MNNIERIYKDNSIKGFASEYIKYTREVLLKISIKEVECFIKAILRARERNSTIYFIGNGGSASTASHFVNDMAIGTRSWDKPFNAISLCDNQAVLSAIANDDGYDHVFSQQLNVYLKKDDVVVIISASGNSKNLINAVNIAKDKKAETIAITSFDGGELKKIVDMSIHVPTEFGEYGPAEDGHIIINHLVGAFLKLYVKPL
jgi:D-sedoheptulose 7-phosphate isomerase